jgi:hypothetical protein
MRSATALLLLTMARSLAAEASDTVGELGDTRRWSFVGTQAFSGDVLRWVLGTDRGLFAAGSPNAPLAPFLAELKHRLEVGYADNGYDRAVIDIHPVTVDGQRRLECRVAEGARVVCAGVTVSGSAHVDEIVKRLTEDAESASEKLRRIATNPRTPCWRKGEPAHRSAAALKSIGDQVQRLLMEDGCLTAAVTATAEEDADHGVALAIHVEHEGAPLPISRVEVVGMTLTPIPAIVTALKVAPGMTCDAALLTRVDRALWESASFLSGSIEARTDPQQPDHALLTITVREHPSVERIDTPFTPTDEAAVRLAGWTHDWLSGRRKQSLLVRLTRAQPALSATLVLSPGRQVLLSASDAASAAQGDALAPTMHGLAGWVNARGGYLQTPDGERWASELCQAFLTLEIVPNPTSGADEHAWSFNFQGGLTSRAEDQAPFALTGGMPPAGLRTAFRRLEAETTVEDKVTHLHWTSADLWIAEDGQPRFALDLAGYRAALDVADDADAPTGADAAAAPGPSKEWFMGFLGRHLEPIAALAGLDPRVTACAGDAGRLLADLAWDGTHQPSAEGEIRFRDDDMAGTSAAIQVLEALLPQVRHLEQTVGYRHWVAEIVRDAALQLLGRPDGFAACHRTLHEAGTGPIGCWCTSLAAMLCQRGDAAQAIARLGLERLGDDAAAKDIDELRPVLPALGAALHDLQHLDDDAAMLGSIGLADADAVRGGLQSLRGLATAPDPSEALRGWWRESGRDLVTASLRAWSRAPAGDAAPTPP